MPRNRQQTENRIREAARNLLRKEGFESWGVNGIARAAGADKVLIYRYFGSLEGLLSVLVQDTSFWPDPDLLPDATAEAFIEATLNALEDHPECLSLLAHPSSRNPVSEIRRKATDDLDRWLEGFRKRTSGAIPADALERLPALMLFQAGTGRDRLTAHDLWRQVSPPLEWETSPSWSANEELPTELL